MSPEKSHKACHSPCFQNRAQKSPLEILRFPFSLSFSHKELMVLFDGWSGFIVKMTKCRRMYTWVYTRKGRQIPPRCTQQAASVHRSSSDSARGQSAGILNERRSIRKLGTFGSWTGIGMRHVGGPRNSHFRVPETVKQVLNSVKQVLNSVKQVLNSVKPSIFSPYSSQTAV